MGIHRKDFDKYILTTQKPIVRLEEYATMPATAFLHAIVSAKCAADLCLKSFKTTKRGTYNVSASKSIQIINAGLLAYIMGNFETYEKYLFAQMFEYSVYLNKFDVEGFIKKLKEATKDNIDISLVRFAGYRNNAHSVGLVIAENLKNWQSPRIVNKYFNAFSLTDKSNHTLAFFSNNDIQDLSILWQMRHSIVHTASTLTLPDSQKNEALKEYGGKSIVLDKGFIVEVVRKFHPIIKNATERMQEIYIHNVKSTILPEIKTKIDNIFVVKSSCNVWLRQ